jgi:hypothetical protein
VPDFRIHIELIKQPGFLPLRDPDTTTAKLRVVFEKLEVLNDQDCFGAGEWKVEFTVNHTFVGGLYRQANTGDVIPLGGDPWTKDVKIPAGGALEILVKGIDEDVIWDDSLGEVRLKFTKASTPSWAIGRWAQKSSNGSFRLTFSIEAPDSQEW